MQMNSDLLLMNWLISSEPMLGFITLPPLVSLNLIKWWVISTYRKLMLESVNVKYIL